MTSSKTLLLLGGSRYLLPVIETANGLGCRVITCDYLPDNIAHKYADEYCNISIIDKDAVLHMAQEKHIDGVMSFACDPGVVTAAYVAEKMGLPSVGSFESVSILQNKGRFRKFLAEHGFNTPTSQAYTDAAAAVRDAGRFHWPVIVKPTDSAGSKGVRKVTDPRDLPAAIENALNNSLQKEFIIEDFLEQVGCSSDSECFSVNGRLAYVSFSAQRFDRDAANPYTPAAFSWPSTMRTAHQWELALELQRLITLLGLKTSIYNVETRECTDGKAYIMEVSPRGGGNRLAEMLGHVTNVDLIRASVQAALGEPITCIEQKPYTGHWAEVILHSKHSGHFSELQIADTVAANVIERQLWVRPGDKVEAFTGANQTLGTVVLRFETNEELENRMIDIPRWLHVGLEEDVEHHPFSCCTLISGGGLICPPDYRHACRRAEAPQRGCAA